MDLALGSSHYVQFRSKCLSLFFLFRRNNGFVWPFLYVERMEYDSPLHVQLALTHRGPKIADFHREWQTRWLSPLLYILVKSPFSASHCVEAILSYHLYLFLEPTSKSRSVGSSPHSRRLPSPRNIFLILSIL